jgi:hypothetical protein
MLNLFIKFYNKNYLQVFLLIHFQEFVLAQEKKIAFDRVSDEAQDLLTEIEQATAVQLTPKVRMNKHGKQRICARTY